VDDDLVLAGFECPSRLVIGVWNVMVFGLTVAVSVDERGEPLSAVM
jgi:hypothetical protein